MGRCLRKEDRWNDTEHVRLSNSCRNSINYVKSMIKSDTMKKRDEKSIIEKYDPDLEY